MKIGVLFCAWQCEDLLPSSLTPWVEAKRARLGGHDYTICAVSVPFEGFPQDETRDKTRSILGAAAQCGEVDHVVVTDKPLKETEARGRALQWLLAQGVDICWQADADEVYTQQDIARIVAFTQNTPDIAWYRLCLRNAVFSPPTFLAEPFTPSRIHRAHVRGYRLHSFCDDNDLLYGGTITRDLKRQDQFASMTVPASVALVRHMSWLNDLRSKRKYEYQQLRWGPPVGAGCAFRWDEAKGLVWNEDHFRLTGQPIPEVIQEG